MKATGIVRNVDDLGRLCLPKEIRRTLHISNGDPMEFFVEGNSIVIRRFDGSQNLYQLVNDLEKSIQLADPMIPSSQLRKLLGKVKEMKIILKEKQI